MTLKEMLQKVGRFFFSRQTNSGSDSVQIGKVTGNLTIVNVAGQQPVRQPVSTVPGNRLRSEQSRVLALLGKLRNRTSVLEFMDRQFGTKMVIHLDERQLFRVRRYVETILESEAAVPVEPVASVVSMKTTIQSEKL